MSTTKNYADGETTYLGIFDTPEKAAQAYAVAAVKHFGSYAKVHGA